MKKSLMVLAALTLPWSASAAIKEVFTQVMPVKMRFKDSQAGGAKRIRICLSIFNDAFAQAGVKVFMNKSALSDNSYLGVISGVYNNKYIVTGSCHEANQVATINIVSAETSDAPKTLLQNLLKAFND